MSWDDDDMDGWGFRLEADYPLIDIADWAKIGAFAGFRGFWDVKGRSAGGGAGVATRTTTTTSGTATKTTDYFYDVTAPLNLDGTLDFPNAEIFEGSVVRYTPSGDSSSHKRTAAFSIAKIEAEADIYQTAIGASLRFDTGRLALSLRPSLLLNWIDAEATRTEVLATAAGKVKGAWTDKADDCAFALGAGLDLIAECALSDNWSLWVSGGDEWIGKVEFDIGPQKVEIDPSAWTATVGVAFSF